MYKSMSLTLKNINKFKKIFQYNTNFSLSNKDFFEQYDNSNIIQKMFLRKNVYLLIEKNNYLGYIWYEKHNKHYTSINSINVISDNNLIYYYETLISPLKSNGLITYECEDNQVNINILSKLGFVKTKGFMELEKSSYDYLNISVPDNITFSIVQKDKDEILRCKLQNDIFSNDDRIPINVEDIYYDEEQDYYFDKGAIFIELDKKPIGYGQIIVEDNVAIIVNFGIIQEYRKEGYGKVLLSYLLNVARDNSFSNISLKVDSNNTFAYKLYRSLGFNIKRELYTWQKTKF